MTHAEQILHDFLLLLAVYGADRVQDLANPNDIVGGIGICCVNRMAGFNAVVEEVVL